MPGELSRRGRWHPSSPELSRLSGVRKVARRGPKCKGSQADFQRFADVRRPDGWPSAVHHANGFPGSLHISVKKLTEKTLPRLGEGTDSAWQRRRGGGYSCNCRFRDSTSSDSALSLATSASILRTACNTVVWSRPPKRRPISGSERRVSVLARYIATWRGRTTFAVRREDKRSERLTLYCRATTRWMSSILIRFGSCGRTRSRTSRSAISSVTGWLFSLECARRRLMAPSRSRPLWVMVRAR